MEDIKKNNTQEEIENKEGHPRMLLTEDSLITERVEVKPVVIRAYCPKCGKEIKEGHPVMYNPFSFEKICPYDCECGLRVTLDHAYPRVVFVDADNNEYDAYCK